MLLRQPHVAQRGFQAFPSDSAVAKPHFIHAREAIRRQPVPASVDDKHSDARKGHDRLSAPFFDELRRHHREAGEWSSVSVYEDAAKRDECLSSSALRYGCRLKDFLATIT